MKFVVTGGAGFIGSNLVYRLSSMDHQVIIIDDLSRKGSEKNLQWLEHSTHKHNISFIKSDITQNHDIVTRTIGDKNVAGVYHLAAQVAVTTSVQNPRHDFEVNALGTFNVLEAVRMAEKKPFLFYSSTNKVYGGMETARIQETAERYEYADFKDGIDESFPLDFHSPYGCSKGTADQYVRDYARIYNLPTVVFRQSCIYGPRQFGVEDQGWVAWFIIALTQNKNITIYGDGKQVRDILYVDDLIDAYLLAYKHRKKLAGQIYNIGGGANSVISVWVDFQKILEKEFKKKITPTFSDWRPGDQKVYVSNIARAYRDFGWKPTIKPSEGVARLTRWVKENQSLFT